MGAVRGHRGWLSDRDGSRRRIEDPGGAGSQVTNVPWECAFGPVREGTAPGPRVGSDRGRTTTRSLWCVRTRRGFLLLPCPSGSVSQDAPTRGTSCRTLGSRRGRVPWETRLCPRRRRAEEAQTTSASKRFRRGPETATVVPPGPDSGVNRGPQ